MIQDVQLEDGSVKRFEDNNPYEIGEKIWEVIRDNFQQYNVEVTQAYPSTPLRSNTITWRILRRIPGTGQDRKFESTGMQPSLIHGKTSDGMIIKEFSQTFQTLIEFGVFSTSNKEADLIAWELEKQVVSCKSIFQKEDNHFQIVFDSQVGDDSLQWRNQDDIITRFLRFNVVNPSRFIVLEKELRKVEIDFFTKTFAKEIVETRLSDSSQHILSYEGYRLSSIQYIQIYKNNQWVMAKPGIDYKYSLSPPLEDKLVITWNESGLVPQLNEKFKVSFTYYDSRQSVSIQ